MSYICYGYFLININHIVEWHRSSSIVVVISDSNNNIIIIMLG
jgi:hypothetical protein